MSVQNVKSKAAKAVEIVRKVEDEEVKEKGTELVSEEVLEEYDFDGMMNLDAGHKNVGSIVRGEGCLTIINHEKCGRRLHFANEIWRKLNCPPFVEVFIKDKKVIVLPNFKRGIAVKFDKKVSYEEAVDNYNSKIVLYSTKSVKGLTEAWNLDFASGCCYTCGTFKKYTVQGKPAVVITNEELEED